MLHATRVLEKIDFDLVFKTRKTAASETLILNRIRIRNRRFKIFRKLTPTTPFGRFLATTACACRTPMDFGAAIFVGMTQFSLVQTQDHRHSLGVLRFGVCHSRCLYWPTDQMQLWRQLPRRRLFRRRPTPTPWTAKIAQGSGSNWPCCCSLFVEGT